MRATLISCVVFAAFFNCEGCDKKRAGSAATIAQTAQTGSPTAEFWSFVAGNEEALANGLLENDPTPTMAALTEKIRNVDRLLIAELALDRSPNAKQTIVISVDGNPAKFELVKSVVAAAPANLKRFKALAFRPRREGDVNIEMQGQTISLSNFFYRELGRSGGKIDLEIMVKGLTPENEKQMFSTANVLLDGALGEYDSATKLGEVQVVPMPSDMPVDAKPLSALSQAVDAL